jgi:hypothetical protein
MRCLPSYLLLNLSFVLVLSACESRSGKYRGEKIDGVCFVGPREPIVQEAMAPIRDVNADWVAIVPYAFAYKNDPVVNYDTTRQWWGETGQGVEQTIRYARKLGFKVMLKPHVWIVRQGWPGEFTLHTEAEWRQWEDSYAAYLDAMTRIAARHKVEIFCIGTVYRIAARERPDYWRQLISDIRQRYTGQLTYAANWDNYRNITFWDALDFIGIDAYFPLSEARNPSVRQLMKGWEGPLDEIEAFRDEYKKPVLFTEFGYRSADYSGRGHWQNEQEELVKNMAAQAKAYEAMFRTFWHRPWFAGGFAWKWYARLPRNSRWNPWETDFTPQQKPAAEVLKEYYSQNQTATD